MLNDLSPTNCFDGTFVILAKYKPWEYLFFWKWFFKISLQYMVIRQEIIWLIKVPGWQKHIFSYGRPLKKLHQSLVAMFSSVVWMSYKENVRNSKQWCKVISWYKSFSSSKHFNFKFLILADISQIFLCKILVILQGSCSGQSLWMAVTDSPNETLVICYINPFHATGLFLYLLETSENQRFSDSFRGCRKRPATWNWLNKTHFSMHAC